MTKKVHYAWWIFISCCFLLFATFGMTASTFVVFARPLSKALHTGMGSIMTTLTFFALFQVICLPIAGRLLAKYDLRKLLSLATVGICASLIVMAFAKSLAHLYIAGAMQGIFGSLTMMITAPIILTTWFRKRIGLVIGIVAACSSLGGAICSPILAGMIVSVGLTTTFCILASAIAVLALPFTIFVIRNKPSDIGLKPYGWDESPSATASALLITGVSQKQAVRSSAFYLMILFTAAMGALSGLVYNFAVVGISKGFSPVAAASMVSVSLVGVIVGKLVWGIASDKFGPVTTIGIGEVLGVAGTILLRNGHLSATYFAAGAFCFGMCFALITVALPLLVRMIFGSKDYGTIYSYMGVAMTVIGALASPLFGFLFDTTKSYDLPLVISAAAMILAFLFAVLASKSGKKLLVYEVAGVTR